MLEEHRPFPDICLVAKDGRMREFSALPSQRYLVILAPAGAEPFIGRISSRLAEIRAFNAEPLVIEIGSPLDLKEPPAFPVMRLADPWEAGKKLGLGDRTSRLVTVAIVDVDGEVRKIYRESVDRPPSVTALVRWLCFLDRNE